MTNAGKPEDFDTSLAELNDWTQRGDAIVREVTCPTFPDAIGAVAAVASVAEEMDHHPDIDIRWRTLTFRCSTHSAGAVTNLDFELAAQIDLILDALADEQNDTD